MIAPVQFVKSRPLLNKNNLLFAFPAPKALFFLAVTQRGPKTETEITIAILPAMADNYAWVLHNGAEAAVVDPGDDQIVQRFLTRNKLRLTHVLVTHHHADHCAGAVELKRAHGCRILGPDDMRIPFVDIVAQDEAVHKILGETMVVIHTPGHTMTHMVYHFPELRALFTGDTLFCGGCGRVLEGTPADMLRSLIKCTGVEDITSVYCGHEYTEENLLFATTVETENKDVWQRLADVKYFQVRNMPTVPSTIAVERLTNPFLRTGSPAIRKRLRMEGANAIEVFAELRNRKDNF
jgi:hydroxyacylglutathione hydrolase